MSGETMEKWLADANERIAELEIESANWHQEYMESLNVRDYLEDMVKDLRAACDQKQEIINADTHIRKDDTARIAELEAENELLREESKIDQLIIKDLLEAENERLQGGTRGASSRWKEIERLREENEELRKDLASWRKGECRRRIDRAMEGK